MTCSRRDNSQVEPSPDEVSIDVVLVVGVYGEVNHLEDVAVVSLRNRVSVGQLVASRNGLRLGDSRRRESQG